MHELSVDLKVWLSPLVNCLRRSIVFLCRNVTHFACTYVQPALNRVDAEVAIVRDCKFRVLFHFDHALDCIEGQQAKHGRLNCHGVRWNN
jgi:hypothetical protein